MSNFCPKEFAQLGYFVMQKLPNLPSKYGIKNYLIIYVGILRIRKCLYVYHKLAGKKKIIKNIISSA